MFKTPALSSTTRPGIHIPFTPFMFAHIYGYQLDKIYNIRYVVADDLFDIESNPLYAAAESDLYYHYKSKFT